ncbi:C-8,7 sterol isomerase isoform 1 [Hibiscus syriacus]|uniref:C-8,7 sterol isomerase isoform 1 n=1 Tax=Hibiscus syriacus TaxID=106335 RepID=A0A6A2WRP7_HIBSY|nr:uncharacterized protein LOC120184536 [Hibiscus syriacus]KAE8663723.1 C-8,7 sterol isomerase isoform 1 [Hibiscus syriacus]
MGWTYLELKLISCKDLKAFNFFQKLSAYSVVSMVVINEQSKKKEEHQKKYLQRQKTSIERGGKNPEWNHVFEFDLRSLSPEETDHVFIKFDLRADVLVDRTIGEVRVPLKGLIDEFGGVVRYLTYQVRNSDGKPNGVLNFSYKLKGKIKTSGNHDSVKFVYGKMKPQAIESSSSPEKSHCSSDKVVYPKVELDDDNHHSWPRDVIRYPSLDSAAYTVPPPFQCQTPVQGMVPGGYFDPYSRPSPVMQPSATYWYPVQSSLQ